MRNHIGQSNILITILIMLYVIMFTASAEMLEDTLLFFHNDAQEFFLDNEVQVAGVAAGALADDLTFSKCYKVKDVMYLAEMKPPAKPDLVHFLHLGMPGEFAAHEELSARSIKGGVRCVNPFNEGTRNCDSKFRMYNTFKDTGIPTPEAVLVSRFNRNKKEVIRDTMKGFGECYIQPDQGTEGAHAYYFSKKGKGATDQLEDILMQVEDLDTDLVVRKKVGNVLYNKNNMVLRINVTFDGNTFAAESGYALTGGSKVVCAAQRAVREDINKVLEPYAAKVEKVKTRAMEAVKVLTADNEAPLVTGVDIVLEQDKGITPYVIDVNPRPVVVGSRLIGQDRLFLGEHFWQGLADTLRVKVKS